METTSIAPSHWVASLAGSRAGWSSDVFWVGFWHFGGSVSLLSRELSDSQPVVTRHPLHLALLGSSPCTCCSCACGPIQALTEENQARKSSKNQEKGCTALPCLSFPTEGRRCSKSQPPRVNCMVGRHSRSFLILLPADLTLNLNPTRGLPC